MDGNNREPNQKQVPGNPGAKVKDFLRDRARDNPDGEEIQRGIIEEARRQIVQRQQLEDNVDAEELNERRHHHHQRQHGLQAHSGTGSSMGGRGRGHGQLSFAEENSVDREEREGSHQGRDRHHRRSSVSSEEQFQRWRWLRECRDGLVSFFVEPFQSRRSRHGRKWYEYTKDEYRQQKLPVLWEPIWNCRSVGRLLLYLSILTMPLAVLIFVTNTQTKELRFTFGEECKNARNYLRLIRSVCTFCGGNLNPNCHKLIEITEDIKLPVYLYYELEGFHQNHRKLTRAMDSDQLMGKIFDKELKPVKPPNCGDYTVDDKGKIYFPCGALANLMFNDDFALITPNGEEVPLRTHGIAFSGLKYHRFKNPPSEIVNQKDYHLRSVFKDNFVKPRSWTTEMWDDWWTLGANENERFINWMNPSAFSHMRKLYAVIDSVPMCPIGILCKGNYTINIEYRYDVDRFEGNKAFILATTSWFGGRNIILAYVVGVIGGLEFAIGLLLMQMHRRYGNVDRCAFSKAEISTIAPSRSRSRRSSRYSHHLPAQQQHHPTFAENHQLHAPKNLNGDRDDNKPIVTKFKRTSETPVSPIKQNPNSNPPPPVAVSTEQSCDTVLDIDSTCPTTTVASAMSNNPPASSTVEGGIATRQTRPQHPEENHQRRQDGRGRGGGGEQEVSLLYVNQDPISFQRESFFVFPDNPHRRHGQENVSLNDTAASSTANDTDTEDDGTLTATASSAVSEAVSEAESFVSYWSNGTMMTADESSSEAEDGGGRRREGMTGGSVPRRRRQQ